MDQNIQISKKVFFDDLLAATSHDYLDSIREAREDYKQGKTAGHKEVF